MTELISLLSSSALFANIPPEDFQLFLEWLSPIERQYSKGQVVVPCGYPFAEFGFLLEGELEGIKPLADGRQLPVGHFLPGSVFGDVLAFSGQDSPVNITALLPSRVLCFSPHSLQKTPCPVPSTLAIFSQNLLAVEQPTEDEYFAQLYAAAKELNEENRQRLIELAHIFYLAQQATP